jgi:hypothetical protein
MKELENAVVSVFLFIILAIIYLLLAFPFMWAWNYIMPIVFELPTIGWLGSFCLLWMSAQILPPRIISVKA